VCPAFASVVLQLLPKVVDLKYKGGFERHVLFVQQQWIQTVLSPTLDAVFGCTNTEYLGLGGGDESDEARDIAATTCVATVGHLDLYAQPLLQCPISLLVVPLLPDSQRSAVLMAAKKEWMAVLEVEQAKPGWLSKLVPTTLYQWYRELLTVSISVLGLSRFALRA
jgi:hypothetical protein